MGRLIWSAQMENFLGKRDFLKVSPKFPNGISERKCALRLSASSRPCAVIVGAMANGTRQSRT